MAEISYKKRIWVNDTEPALNATNLNGIEDGISAVTAQSNSNSAAITAEAARAKAAEADLSTKANANSAAITAEATRAKNAEAAITKQLNGFHLFVNSSNNHICLSICGK